VANSGQLEIRFSVVVMA